jgi:dynein heavy chain
MEEELRFSKEINPLNDEKAPRNVEDWLKEMEKQMKLSIKEYMAKAIQDYPVSKRADWVLKWPAQVVTTLDQLFWTQEVVAALANVAETPDGLKTAFTNQNKRLLQIVDMVRLDVPAIHRMTLGVLVVVEVHAKDTIQELIDQQVSSVTAFEWLAQLRYYWEKESLYVIMVNTERHYGFEYLGNQTRLVITPLTDRCYRTLMSALQMNLGGAPEGPAGTGKTETTKDLAKAIA